MTSPEPSRARGVLARAFWPLIPLLPLWSIYLAHVVTGPNRPTGFIMAEMPYYCANGREIFERGNGLMYCNPYDRNPAAPVIYFHWLPWLLGCLIKPLHIPPGIAYVAVGGVAGYACSWLMFRLVEAVLPRRGWAEICHLAVMWGGGVFVLAAIVSNIAAGRPPPADLLRFDPFEGWWCLNWGRNLVMPTEAVYHALVAFGWLAIVGDRPWRAVAAVTALALTHPFSGIQHLLVTGAWFVMRRPKSLAAALPLVTLVIVTTAFCAYYFGYLPAFPAHREIHETWSLEWNLPLVGLLAGYTPVACLAAARCRRDWRCWRPEMTFFLVAAAVSLVLVKHELFMPSRQPLHFTRGYVWTPLCLLGLPLVQSLCEWGFTRPLQAARVAACAAAALLAVLDNAAFIVTQWTQPWDRHQDVRVSESMGGAFELLDRSGLRGTVLIVKPPGDDWEDYNYLVSTYTGMTPLLGHPFLTPAARTVQAELAAWEATGAISKRIADLEAMVVPAGFPADRLPGGSSRWRLLGRSGSVVVMVRTDASAKAAP